MKNKLRWWEYPLAIGVMLMLVGGGLHFSITSKGKGL
jgi:hypothetical protein